MQRHRLLCLLGMLCCPAPGPSPDRHVPQSELHQVGGCWWGCAGTRRAVDSLMSILQVLSQPLQRWERPPAGQAAPLACAAASKPGVRWGAIAATWWATWCGCTTRLISSFGSLHTGDVGAQWQRDSRVQRGGWPKAQCFNPFGTDRECSKRQAGFGVTGHSVGPALGCLPKELLTSGLLGGHCSPELLFLLTKEWQTACQSPNSAEHCGPAQVEQAV